MTLILSLLEFFRADHAITSSYSKKVKVYNGATATRRKVKFTRKRKKKDK